MRYKNLVASTQFLKSGSFLKRHPPSDLVEKSAFETSMGTIVNGIQ